MPKKLSGATTPGVPPRLPFVGPWIREAVALTCALSFGVVGGLVALVTHYDIPRWSGLGSTVGLSVAAGAIVALLVAFIRVKRHQSPFGLTLSITKRKTPECIMHVLNLAVHNQAWNLVAQCFTEVLDAPQKYGSNTCITGDPFDLSARGTKVIPICCWCSERPPGVDDTEIRFYPLNTGTFASFAAEATCGHDLAIRVNALGAATKMLRGRVWADTVAKELRFVAF